MWIKITNNGKVRYCERYTDPMTGKKKDFSVTYDKDNARNRKEAARILQLKADGAYCGKADKFTLGRLAQEFLADQELSVAESTYKNMRSQIKGCVSILGADVLVDKLTARYFRNAFLSSGRSAKTLHNYFDKFRTMWLWAYKNDIIPSKDLIDKVGEFRDESPEEEICEKFLEADEVKALLAAVKKEEHQLIFKVLFLSGLRVGEAIALTNDDIDFAKKQIRINKSFSTLSRKVTSAKTIASNDTIYMQPELEEAVKQLMAYTKLKQVRYGIRTSLLFCGMDGGHYNYTTLYRAYKKAALVATGKDVSIHSTRHTHCSLLFEQGFTLDQCQRRLRHENSDITRKIYIHITERLKEKDAEKLRAISLL